VAQTGGFRSQVSVFIRSKCKKKEKANLKLPEKGKPEILFWNRATAEKKTEFRTLKKEGGSRPGQSWNAGKPTCATDSFEKYLDGKTYHFVRVYYQTRKKRIQVNQLRKILWSGLKANDSQLKISSSRHIGIPKGNVFKRKRGQRKKAWR